MPAATQIMCVDADGSLAGRVRGVLAQSTEVTVQRESSLGRAVEGFDERAYDVLLVSGRAVDDEEQDIELLEIVSAKSPATQVLFVTDRADIALAMSALRAGSYQYIREPVGDEELQLVLETALAQRPAFAQNVLQRCDRPAQVQQMIGRSGPMQELYRQIRQAAATDIPVLLTGETGTGKDLAAAAVHQGSNRAEAPYVPVHLGALPQELVASELFGHERGAFTGALERHIGRFEQAHKGTVFLDEISTLDERTQISLLRLLEQCRINRIGGRRAIRADVRVVAATNDDLLDLVERGRFREDLYYRLNVFHIVLPPLRDRHGDIPLLMDAFIKRFEEEFQKHIVGVSPECVALFEQYPWPGNVRELKNVLQRAVLVCMGSVLLPTDLPPRFRREAKPAATLTFRVGTSLAEVERVVLQRTLEAKRGNKKRTAEVLGISRRALYNKLRRLNDG